MKTQDEITAAEIFSEARTKIPSASKLGEMALAEILGMNAGNKKYIKENFSELVVSTQVLAYARYQEFEAKASGDAIRKVFTPLLPANASAGDVFDLIGERFSILDRYFLSLTQSRRPRAGSTFEAIVSTLFKELDYPYTSQPEVDGSRPDYVLPGIEWYKKYSGDCIIFTCKRTLRERWRQVITEGMTGQSFFLATIDEGLSDAELSRMKDRRVIVVVPSELKESRYPAALNVISFEDFFLHHLDPAIVRWRAKGVI